MSNLTKALEETARQSYENVLMLACEIGFQAGRNGKTLEFARKEILSAIGSPVTCEKTCKPLGVRP